MRITFAPRGILQIDDAKIVYRNFSGSATKFNREGDRNFSVVIDSEEYADNLVRDGWNVKIREAREPGDSPFITLPVKVKFNDRGPNVYLTSGDSTVKLDETTVNCIDEIDIESVDLDIRPYDWEVNGRTGRTAYLQDIHVTQRVDRFASRYSNRNVDDDDLPF